MTCVPLVAACGRSPTIATLYLQRSRLALYREGKLAYPRCQQENQFDRVPANLTSVSEFTERTFTSGMPYASLPSFSSRLSPCACRDSVDLPACQLSRRDLIHIHFQASFFRASSEGSDHGGMDQTAGFSSSPSPFYFSFDIMSITTHTERR
jgi:hypothetical protein